MSTNYESTAHIKPGAKRPRLVSLWMLAGFVTLVLAPLVIAFLKQDLLRQAERERLGDALSVSYLTNLLRTEQDNLELRVVLAEHKIYLGELAGVTAIIDPVLRSTDREWRAKGLLTMYKYVTQEYAHARPGSAQQDDLMKRRRAFLVRLAGHPWPLPTLVYLAREATGLHERAVGVQLYRKISESSKQPSMQWCAEIAARVLSEGDYEFAAELYFVSREKDSSLARQREYLIAGIRALLANSMFTQAMAAADQHLGNLADDAETLNFLIQAARASNDQERAARFAKRLLHLSWLERAYAWLQRFDLNIIGSAAAAPLDRGADLGGMKSYDAKKYQLAYDVFLENHNLAEAYRVAEAAVRQRPKDADWHKRLAKVAEWLNRPAIALREWLWLLRHGRDEAALLEVLRIAPALDDYGGALEAWLIFAERRSLSEEQWNAVADLFEKTGRQGEGISYFEARYNREHKPSLLETAARLAERSGDDERAQSAYLRLIKLHGFRSEWALKVANLYLQKGENKKAYQLLKKNAGNVSNKDVSYWKLLGDLAWQLQLDGDAVKDYRRLAAGGNLGREEFDRLVYLLGEARSEEVAALAELAYRKYGDVKMLIRALEVYAARHDLVAQRRLFVLVAADSNTDAPANARVQLMYAQYLYESGAFQAAHTAFRRAASLAPDDPSTVTAFLWFLIDAHDQTALHDLMAKLTERGDQANPAYWGAFAAAYDVLEQPATAVAYYSRELKQNGEDFLWLVNYADALEEAQQASMALRVRGYAWRQLHGRLHGKPLRLPFSADMLAAARLAVRNQPGDPGSEVVRGVLRQDRLVKHDTLMDNQISELVLGWAVSKEQSANAKAWLWRRYGRTLNRPAWGDAMVAMAETDTERLDQLLAEQPEAVPMPIRHDAASALQENEVAQSIAFYGLAANPGNEEAHQRLTDDALAAASFVNLQASAERFGTMRLTTENVVIETPIARNLRLAAEFWHTHQTDIEPLDLGNVPSTEKLAGLALKIHSGAGDTELAARRRHEFANTTEAHAIHEMNVSQNLYIKLAGEVNAEAGESNNLRVFGMRDHLYGIVHYSFTERDYVSVEPGYTHYYTQTNNFLGNGRQAAWELGHRITPMYPDLRVGVIGMNERFSADRRAILPLPPDQNLYGACLGFVEDYRHPYSKAWRPYFDACGTHNNVSGKGYIGKIGIVGSLAGHDQLTVSFLQEQGGVKVVNGLERHLMLNYRYFFDRY